MTLQQSHTASGSLTPLDNLTVPIEPHIRLLSEADRALAHLDAATEFLPHPELFVRMYVRKEAVLSTQIEGTQASMVDVLDHEAGATPAQRYEDVTEVKRYMAALWEALERLSELPKCVRLIRQMHRVLLTESRGEHRNLGEFRPSRSIVTSTTPRCNGSGTRKRWRAGSPSF